MPHLNFHLFCLTCAECLTVVPPVVAGFSVSGKVSSFEFVLYVRFDFFCLFVVGVLISVLVYLQVITDGNTFSVGEIQTGLQNFCICIEMFCASVTHKFTFPASDYEEGMTMLLKFILDSCCYLHTLTRAPFVFDYRQRNNDVTELEEF
jgi:hypothetical protein